jgi:hypothetical protein
MKSNGESPDVKKPPPWAGKTGLGYEFDEDGDLLWYASASFMAPKGPTDSEGRRKKGAPLPPPAVRRRGTSPHGRR